MSDNRTEALKSRLTMLRDDLKQELAKPAGRADTDLLARYIDYWLTNLAFEDDSEIGVLTAKRMREVAGMLAFVNKKLWVERLVSTDIALVMLEQAMDKLALVLNNPNEALKATKAVQTELF